MQSNNKPDLKLIKQIVHLNEQIFENSQKKKRLYASEMDLDMTVLQMQCCMIVSEFTQIKMSEIASALNLQTSGATQLIKKLVQKQMVERVYDPLDRRTVFICLTAIGLEKINKIKTIHKEVMTQNFVNLSQKDAQILLEIYQKLV